MGEARATGAHGTKWGVLIALTILVAALCFVGIGLVDRPLAVALKQFDRSLVTDIFRVITKFGQATGYLIVAAILAAVFRVLSMRTDDGARKQRLVRRSYQAFYIFVCLAAPALLVNTSKVAVGRARPRLFFREDVYGFFPMRWTSDYWSMPSGHTATAFALATALYLLWPRYWYLYFTGALLIGASRVVTTVHFLSDVIASAWLCILLSLFVKVVFARLRPDIFPAPGGR